MSKLTLLLLALTLIVVLDYCEGGWGRNGHRGSRKRGHHRAMGDRQHHRNGRPGHHRGHRGRGHRRGPFQDWWSRMQSRALPSSVGQTALMRIPWRNHFNVFAQEGSNNPFMSFNFGWGQEFEDKQPWWEGPNVCEEEKEEMVNNTETGNDIRTHISTKSQTCDESETAYKCTLIQENVYGRLEKTSVLHCCHGFSRAEGDFGCPTALEMLDLRATAEKLGLTDFLSAVETLKLTGELQEGNFTVFAPVNGAFGANSDLMSVANEIILKDAPDVIMISEPAAERALRSLQDAILSHMVLDPFRTSNLADEQVLETGSPLGSTIRINYFTKPKKLMTANCVRVLSTDNAATNGIIHTVEKTMKPVTETLMDMVKKRPELSTLKTAIASANYVSTLDDNGQLTLLAPTNAAFEKMNSRLRERLLGGDSKCIEKVLKAHLLPNVICSLAIQGEARTPNLLKHYVNVTRTEDDKVFTDSAQVIQSDLMASNGVMHVIDDVIVPEEALSFVDVLEKKGFTGFLSLVDEAGLSKMLETTHNVTVFAPSNEAIENLPVAVKTKLMNNPDMLKEVLTFHLSPGVKECRRLYNNQILPTLGEKEIRINSYSNFPFHHESIRTAQCIPIKTMNIEACDGRINVIDEVMFPPKGNVIDVLSLDKKFSTFMSLVKKAEMADMLQSNGPFTIFAPNNKAFADLNQDILASLKNNLDKLKDVISRHVFENTLCCAGIFRGSWFGTPRIRTLSNDYLSLSRSRDGLPKVDGTSVVKCDLTATNGNILEINDVLLPAPPRSTRRWGHFPRWSRFEP